MRKKIKENLPDWLIPRFDELSLFLMSISLLLLLGDVEFRNDAYNLAKNKSILKTTLWVYLFGFGLALTHVFLSRRKSEFEKTALICFAMSTNIMCGLIGGLKALQDSFGIEKIFPIWNITCAIILLILWRLDLIDKENIPNENTTLPELFTGLTALGIIFILSALYFQEHWTTTYSACVIYATTISKLVQRFIISKKSRTKHKRQKELKSTR
jgi:hypothetical protein